MKLPYLFYCLFIFSFSNSIAQSPPVDLVGIPLRTWLKRTYYDKKHRQLGYTVARRHMYGSIDNSNNRLTCVYSGYQKSWQAGGMGTDPSPMNAEHTVPQSFFDKAEPMRSDLHHLFPVFKKWNSERSNHKFAEIQDSKTVMWLYLNISYRKLPVESIDAYSESDRRFFEPQEGHKGNIARAIFYFYTMYPTQGGRITDVADLKTLLQWHKIDPVDASERARNNAIEAFQKDRNPYVDHPEWVQRAWDEDTMDEHDDQEEEENDNDSGPLPPEPMADAGIFISEYVEGNMANKALEVANLSGKDQNLDGYVLRKQTNGKGPWGPGFELKGRLAQGAVIVIANRQSSNGILHKADVKTGHPVMTFNGNDPIGLFYKDKLIDVVGRYAGGSYNFAMNRTLIRKQAFTTGNTVFRVGEWNFYVMNSFEGLGNLNLGQRIVVEPVEWKADLYPNPSSNHALLAVTAPQGKQLHLQLHDALGRLVHEQSQAAQGFDTLKTPELESGSYILSLFRDGSVAQTMKLIVR